MTPGVRGRHQDLHRGVIGLDLKVLSLRLALMVAVVAVLPACQSGPSHTPVARPVQVLQTGFGGDPSYGSDDEAGDGRWVWAVAMVKNPTDRLLGITVAFQAVDQRAHPVGEVATNDAAVLRAGQTTAIGAQLVVPWDRTIAGIRVTARGAVLSDGPDVSSTSTFEVQSSVYEPEVGRQPPINLGSVSGLLASHLKRSSPHALVTAVCFNAKGAIIGGGDAQPGPIPHGATVRFEISEVTATTRPASCR